MLHGIPNEHADYNLGISPLPLVVLVVYMSHIQYSVLNVVAMGHFPLILDSEKIFLKDQIAFSGKVTAMMTMADSVEENVEVIHPTSLSTIIQEIQLSLKSS